MAIMAPSGGPLKMASLQGEKPQGPGVRALWGQQWTLLPFFSTPRKVLPPTGAWPWRTVCARVRRGTTNRALPPLIVPPPRHKSLQNGQKPNEGAVIALFRDDRPSRGLGHERRRAQSNAAGLSSKRRRSPLEDLDQTARTLDSLGNEEREAYRDANAQAIAEAAAARLLIVAGPGAGKSHLFISRIEHWLSRGDSRAIYVATFVRKLIRDLGADIERRLSEQDKALVSASTLHTLARSLLERSAGAAECQFREHIRIIDGSWAPILWRTYSPFTRI